MDNLDEAGHKMLAGFSEPAGAETTVDASYCPSRFGTQPHAFNAQKCGYCGKASTAGCAALADGGPTDAQRDAMHKVVSDAGGYRRGLIDNMWRAARLNEPAGAGDVRGEAIYQVFAGGDAIWEDVTVTEWGMTDDSRRRIVYAAKE